MAVAQPNYNMQQIKRERLNRGVVAIRHGQQVIISWRTLTSDAKGQPFDIYRNGEKLNREPLTKGGTFFVDENPLPTTTTYEVRGGAVDGRYVLNSDAPDGYLSVRLQKPADGETPDGRRYFYSANDASVGDVDGDGQYEIILKWDPSNAHDNAHDGYTGPTIFDCYKLSNGKSSNSQLLWRIDLGRNIREGAHYTQFMVYDLDGDGRAEVACKTADGTIDGQGNVIGDATADWRELEPPYIGHILSGPEYLTVFDGASGKALATTAYNPPRHPDKLRPTTEELQAIWGDGKGNRADRYLACVAYLDGQHPSLVMCRGYYTRNVLAAWNYRDGQLTPVWTFDSDDPDHPENYIYRGNGNHNLSVADVDGDGCDEIIYGNMVVDHDGRGLYCTRIGHADAMHVSDLDPDRPGLEVFNSQEPVGPYGMNFRHAGTGEIYWNVPTDSVAVSYERKVQGPGRVAAFDIDPRYRGSECWVLGGGIYGLYNCRGELISERTPRSCNFGIWWDGDLQRELLDRNQIFKYNWQTEQLEEIFRAEDCTSNNGTKATPALSGDLWGDWREEVIFRTRDNRELRIYSTTTASPYRLVTLLQDPVYRLGLVWQNVAYNIPPHLSYYIGE